MLRIHVFTPEGFNEATGSFVNSEFVGTLELEHSPKSLRLWEGRYERPFLSEDPMTPEESLDYIKMMSDRSEDDPIFSYLNAEHMTAIKNYLHKKHTATTIHSYKNHTSKKIVTAEVIYSWMIESNMDVGVFETWNLNQVLTLIQIIQINRNPDNKMSEAETLRRFHELNQQRKKGLPT